MHAKVKDYLPGILMEAALTGFFAMAFVFVSIYLLLEARQLFKVMLGQKVKKPERISPLDFVHADLEILPHMYVRVEAIVLEEIEPDVFRVLANGHEMSLPGIMLCKQEKETRKALGNHGKQNR